MSNDAYQNAIARLDLLRKEIAEIEQFLTLYQKFGTPGVAPDATPKAAENGPKQPEINGSTHKRRSMKKLKPAVLKDLAKKVILEAGHPLTRGQIVQAIEAQGYTIPGNDKPQHVGTVLWRFKDEMPNITGRGYWPKDKPIPPSGESVN